MKYESNWESIDSRPVPQWFEDAKFGIFIHWGLYSVPAFAKKGDYAEWYAWAMREEGSPISKFHAEKYGKAPYNDFVKDFKAELFDAEQWVSLFEKAGAKYMNLVSKHHDGYCLFESSHAWNWNSVDLEPHRDFCAELKAACDKSSVRFGVYHSLYEWFHPLYLKNPERFAVEHLIPMMKEMIEKYQPATLFTDGEWDQTPETWHSTEFLSWLYNESSVKDFIVPNDRWGKGTRGFHGGNITTEYGFVDGSTDFADVRRDRPFEECRGIGRSFGLNRIEETEDYLSAKELIEMLVDLVSKGGNFLLNVGPAADGTIPVIMQERLLQIGEWLRVNGEGIYGSRSCGFGGEEVKYTSCNGKVYAFTGNFPFKELLLNELNYNPNTKATLLGSTEKIEVENKNGKINLKIPPLNPDKLESDYVYTFCIEGL